MDIVYLIKADPENDSEELRYSLRSLQNIPHNKVFIVGEKPDWATNVEYIPVPQIKTKIQNWRMNLVAAVNSELVSDDFIMMNDDFFITKQMSEIPNMHFGNMEDIIKTYNKRYPEGSDYISRMTKLYELLKDRGYAEPISYELHTPMVLNKHKVQQLYGDVEHKPLYQFRTYYGNHFNVGGYQANDVKIFVDPVHNDPAYNHNPDQYLSSQALLSTTGGSFKRGLPGDFIRKSFTEKSPYEI